MKYSGAFAAILLVLGFGGEDRAEDPAPKWCRRFSRCSTSGAW